MKTVDGVSQPEGLAACKTVMDRVIWLLRQENVRRCYKTSGTKCVVCNHRLLNQELYLSPLHQRGDRIAHVYCAVQELQKLDSSAASHLETLVELFKSKEGSEFAAKERRIKESLGLEIPVAPIGRLHPQDIDAIAMAVMARFEYPLERLAEAVDKLEKCIK